MFTMHENGVYVQPFPEAELRALGTDEGQRHSATDLGEGPVLRATWRKVDP